MIMMMMMMIMMMIFQGTGKYTTTLVIRMVSSEDEGQFLFTENGAVLKRRKIPLTLNGVGFLLL